MHSFFSFDGGNSSVEMAAAAYDKGLRYICFTEHHNINPDFCKPVRFEEYLETIAELREKYRGRMTVLAGIEYDRPESFSDELRRVQGYKLDMIMGSMHDALGEYIGTPEPFKHHTPEEILREHYRLTVIAAQQGMIDVIGHFDLPLRSSPDPDVDLREERLEALRAIAENGIAIEINTNGLRAPYGRTLPTQSVLREFAELGGKYVLFGSDAHCTNDIASFFEVPDGYDLCGLTPGVFIERKFVPVYDL